MAALQNIKGLAGRCNEKKNTLKMDPGVEGDAALVIFFPSTAGKVSEVCGEGSNLGH